MRLTVVFTVAGALVLTGCAAQVSSSMAAWEGRTEREAVAAFGAPDRRHDFSDGAYVLAWEGSRIVSVNGAPISGVCERELTFGPDGRVTRWRWEGNDCRAISP